MIHTVRYSPSKAVAAVLLTLCFFLGGLVPAFAANGISNEQIAAASKIARQMEDEAKASSCSKTTMASCRSKTKK